MPTLYVRNLRTGLAAPLDDAEDFIEDDPKGRFRWFDADTGKAVPAPENFREVSLPDPSPSGDFQPSPLHEPSPAESAAPTASGASVEAEPEGDEEE